MRPLPESRRTDTALSSGTCWCETVLSRTNASLCPEVVLFCVHYCVCPPKLLPIIGVLTAVFIFSVGCKFREIRVCSRTLKYFSLTRGLLCFLVHTTITSPDGSGVAAPSFFARRTMQFLTTR